MRKVLPIILLLLIAQFCVGQNINQERNKVFTNQSQVYEINQEVKEVISYLQAILQTIENSNLVLQRKATLLREYISEGNKKENLLQLNLKKILPKDESLQKTILNQFHFLLQSVALYRSDLKGANFTETESSSKEYEYLKKHTPELINRLHAILEYQEAKVSNLLETTDSKTNQIDFERATMLLRIILPSENLQVTNYGIINTAHSSLEVDFSISRELKKEIITINYEEETFSICCSAVTEDISETEFKNYYVAIIHSFKKEHLEILKELKTIMDTLTEE
jgi:small-conductance mechanosensitive channel